MSDKFDLVVLGGGPGGYVAAIEAARNNMSVAVVESDAIGGTCVNWGCIPTKALLKCAEVYHNVKHSSTFGVDCGKSEKVKPDLKKMFERSRVVADKLMAGAQFLMKHNNITVIKGQGKLLSSGAIAVVMNGEAEVSKEVRGDNVIIATGAKARELPFLKIDHKYVLDSRDAMSLTDLPASLLVVGSGAIGIEFAGFYSTLGTKVTIVEKEDRILLHEDDEVSAMVQKSFQASGVDIHVSSGVRNIKVDKGQVRAEIVQPDGSVEKKKFSKVISAVGVVPNSSGIGLEDAGITLNAGGFIEVSDYLETSRDGVYAIGDVTTVPLLAHKASHQGLLCVKKILGQDGIKPIKQEDIPSCIYSYPQVASIGLTERKAKENGFDIRVGKASGMSNGKAVALGEEKNSFVKTIFCAKTGELLGAHMVGADVVEMIQGFALMKRLEGVAEDVFDTIFPHPTMSEMMYESVLSAYGRAIHG